MGIWAKWVESDGRFLYGLADNGGVEITAVRHLELLAAGSAGQVVRPGKEGVPEIAEPAPPSDDVLRDIERSWRDSELSRYEWIVTRHRDEVEMGYDTSITSEQFAELMEYRKALRDWPAADAFPEQMSRPAPPDWLVQLNQ
ncbi:phage tail assembly chaperone [Pseudomonas sp. Irchel 3E13]|uniref:phage tail assembly chaperone n=1 Tax=Pseudomonas sp. Irchel 3E13 TaxID=2008975 RepID=UPI000BA34DE6|nr:phage tail assembly chaperone [Pseudomonas sp. Irchel 3E13]